VCAGEFEQKKNVQMCINNEHLINKKNPIIHTEAGINRIFSVLSNKFIEKKKKTHTIFRCFSAAAAVVAVGV
jgi:hypothetical protein